MKTATNKFFFIAFLTLVFVLIHNICFAAADTSIIAQIVNEFDNKSAQITTVTKKYALQIFGLCATLEIAWLGVQAALGRAEIGETIKNFCITLVACGFFLACINNYQEWSRAVVYGLENVAGDVGAMDKSSDLAFKEGMRLVYFLWENVQTITGFSASAIGTILGLVFAALICLIACCLITAQVVLIKCEAFIAMAAACILVGLGGSSFFRDYAKNTLRYIVSVGFKLFVMQLVIVTGYQMLRQCIQSSQKVDFGTAIVAVGITIIILALVKSLPEVVAGIINGSHTGSGSGFASTMQTVGAAAAGAAIASAAGARNVGLAAQTARAQGATGIGGTIAGTARNLWSASREAAHSKDDRQNTVSSALREQLTKATAKNVKNIK